MSDPQPLVPNANAIPLPSANNDNSSNSINRLSLKIPPFWKTKPHLWFMQLEAQFVTANITVDQTKFYHVVGALDMEILEHVSDLVASPPQNGPYQELKKRIIDSFSDSEEKQIKQLLTSVELGDSKPSHLLRRMRELAKNKVNDQFLKSLWLQRMPSNIQAILSVSDEGDLGKIALLADKIMEVSDNSNSCSNLAPLAKASTSNDLTAQISALSGRVDELTKIVRGRNQFRSRSRGRYRANSRKRSTIL